MEVAPRLALWPGLCLTIVEVVVGKGWPHIRQRSHPTAGAVASRSARSLLHNH